ncbi:MAG: DUF6514 family protein [Oscillospiraceae bacterium]|nr:DUF6514 family protein [Oscillospiraceae bacterium]
MRKIRARRIPISAVKVGELEYSVIIRDIFNYNGDVVGEIYGVGIKSQDGFAEIHDLTTHWSSIYQFAEKLRENTVTPVTLRDVVYDSLPL